MKERTKGIDPKYNLKRIKSHIIDDQLVSRIIKLKPNHHISIKRIIKEYNDNHNGINVCHETMRKVMRNRLGLRYMKPKLRNFKTLTNQHRCLTAIYLHKILQLILGGCEIIYIDESSFSNTKCNFKTWLDPYEKNPNFFPGRLKSLNLILASTKNKILYYTFNTFTNKSEHFRQFLEDLLKVIRSDDYLYGMFKADRVWVYVDNAGIHKTSEIKGYCRYVGLNIIYAPPYRPEFNLIEHIFGYLKRKFYDSLINNEYI